MKDTINGLNKAFESRIKLGIMSALAMHVSLDFNALKEYLDATDGNLASHLKTLEKEGYVGVEKSFIGKKPNTRYAMTAEGKQAFEDHLKALETLIKVHRD